MILFACWRFICPTIRVYQKILKSAHYFSEDQKRTPFVTKNNITGNWWVILQLVYTHAHATDQTPNPKTSTPIPRLRKSLIYFEKVLVGKAPREIWSCLSQAESVHNKHNRLELSKIVMHLFIHLHFFSFSYKRSGWGGWLHSVNLSCSVWVYKMFCSSQFIKQWKIMVLTSIAL